MKILDRASNGKKLELKEMLYIRKYKPSLNVQKDSQIFTFIIRNSKQDIYKSSHLVFFCFKQPIKSYFYISICNHSFSNERYKDFNIKMECFFFV